MEIRIADKDTLDKVAIAVGASNNKIYGIRINKKDGNPETRCEYLGDAIGMKPAKMNFDTGRFEYGDWADVWFVRDNFPCMLKPNGSIAYKLNPNDYSLKEDGTMSDIEGDVSIGINAMSAMPTVWIWQYELGDYKYIYLANYKVNDNYHAYAHQKEDGTIAPYLFMSIYKGSLIGDDPTLRSLSGQQPIWMKTAETEVSYALANGDYWYTKTWSQRNLMQCLLTMIFCSTNSQEKLGNGNLNNIEDTSVFNGILKTGTLNDKGQFYGYNDNTHQVKAFHQEAVWGDINDRIAGLINDNNIIKVKMTPPYNFDGTGYTSLSIDLPSGAGSGFINKTLMTEFGDFPTECMGSENKYECDSFVFTLSLIRYAIVGGGCTFDLKCGIYNLNLSMTPLGAHWTVGASLSCLP